MQCAVYSMLCAILYCVLYTVHCDVNKLSALCSLYMYICTECCVPVMCCVLYMCIIVLGTVYSLLYAGCYMLCAMCLVPYAVCCVLCAGCFLIMGSAVCSVLCGESLMYYVLVYCVLCAGYCMGAVC